MKILKEIFCGAYYSAMGVVGYTIVNKEWMAVKVYSLIAIFFLSLYLVANYKTKSEQ